MSRPLAVVVMWICFQPAVVAAGVKLSSPDTSILLALYVGAMSVYCSLPGAALVFRLRPWVNNADNVGESDRKAVLRVLRAAVPLSALSTALLGLFSANGLPTGLSSAGGLERNGDLLLFAFRGAFALVAVIAAAISYAIVWLLIRKPARTPS